LLSQDKQSLIVSGIQTQPVCYLHDTAIKTRRNKFWRYHGIRGYRRRVRALWSGAGAAVARRNPESPLKQPPKLPDRDTRIDFGGYLIVSAVGLAGQRPAPFSPVVVRIARDGQSC
jgi:hypothetical protein